MKSLLVLIAALTATSTLFAQELQTRGGQGTFVVSETWVEDLDQNQTECKFRVNIVDFIADQACVATAEAAGSCERAIEVASFVDQSCSVTKGAVILSTTDQIFSAEKRGTGVFTWIQLNAGYSSDIMFLENIK